MKSIIKILIAEDHLLMREVLLSVLDNEPAYEVIATTGDSDELIELSRKMNPDIVLLDMNLKGINALDAVSVIRSQSPGRRILGMSWYLTPHDISQLLRKGAGGHIIKTASTEEILTAIREVNEGREYICDETRKMLQL